MDLPERLKIFDLNKLADPYKEKYITLQQYLDSIFSSLSNYTNVVEKTEINFIENKFFDAVAFSTKAKHFVGISAATPTLLHFCFNVILQQPKIFNNVGIVEIETKYSHLNGFPFEFNLELELEDIIKKIPSISRPTDDKRAKIASFFSEVSAIMIMFHEIAHVICGHTKYFSNNYDELYFSEFLGIERVFANKQKLRLVSEYEADVVSTNFLITFFFEDKYIQKEIESLFNINRADGNFKYESTGILTFIVLNVFLYIGQKRLTDLGGNSYYHPHPLVRMNYIQKAMFATLNRDYGLKVNELSDVAGKCSRELIETWIDLGFKLHNSIKKNEILNSEIVLEVDKLELLQNKYHRYFKKYSWLKDYNWKTYTFPEI